MKRNFFYNIIISLSNILFPIVTFPYASHILGPVGIGKVQFAISFAQYFALIAALGIPIYGVKEIAQAKGDKERVSRVFSELLFIGIFTSILLTVVYLGVIFSIPYFDQDRSFYVLAGTIIILGFSSIDWFYSGLEEFRGIAVRSVLVKVISLIILFSTVKSSSDYDMYLLMVILSFTANNIISFVIVFRKTRVVLPNVAIFRHLKPSFNILSTTIAASMYTILDSVLLGFLADEKSVGLYTAAIKLVRITLPVVTSLGVVLIPQIAKSISEGKAESTQTLLDKSFSFLVFFSVPIMSGLVILAPEFVAVFSGEKFKDAVFSMQILALLPVFVGFGHLFAFQILVPNDRSKEMLFSVVGGMFVALFMNFLLVPAFKHVGASIANVCSEIMVTGLYFYFIRKYYTFTYQWSHVFRAIICSLLFMPAVSLIRCFNLSEAITLLISVIGCSLLYFAVQLFVFQNALIYNFVHAYNIKLVKGGS